ncbi:thioredoxin reductase [Encephalitozoon hellem ATCC 50504]|uniref:Thioredoxin reductase n=1 Tax=Encephalitozoon hellem TaxID=27973 RepID=A0A9Q9C736_ENCHE|nr:thioredoxin reductase [Encephalitozoon hellem ATCC 50504]AFM97841.1 thioredoxin reductase [Encephalitozoon hellem ATCC 50504]UTX42620.1 thioredoxin reductase [Encephalitozoon hellem]WEL38076.1 thioredoxin reductase [Encephalitozoon hellem]|eukprot:XP_003886822.1 thioredoxin reductase [Encephalitozoon hellem ATCC 50504]
MEKIVIIGSGPAAYNAALYAMSKNPLLFEGGYIGNNGPGGQLTTTTAVDNYPGFPDGVEGPILTGLMKEHAVSQGLRVAKETISDVRKEGEMFVVVSEKGEYRAEAVIVATGASARRLFVPGTGDDEFWQKGVSSCAVCDGFIYMNKIVCVVGGGDAAMEEALYLSRIAKKVYIIHRRSEFRARSDMVERAKATENIEIMTPYVLDRVSGTKKVEEISVRNVETGEMEVIPMNGVFFGIGHDPNTSFLKSINVELDPNGYVVVKDEVCTSIPGLFAAGDVCDRKYRQAVTAAASGAISGMKAVEFLDKK